MTRDEGRRGWRRRARRGAGGEAGEGPATGRPAAGGDRTEGPEAPDVPLDELVAAARRLVHHARRTADGVPVGFRIGAEVDAMVAELRCLDERGVTERDRARWVALVDRARRAVNQARQEARKGDERTVAGTAALYLDRRGHRDGPGATA